MTVHFLHCDGPVCGNVRARALSADHAEVTCSTCQKCEFFFKSKPKPAYVAPRFSPSMPVGSIGGERRFSHAREEDGERY